MTFVSRLWPSDDDDGGVTNIDFDVGDGGGDSKFLWRYYFQNNEDQENRGLFWRLLLMKSFFHLLLLSFLLISALVYGER